MALRDVQDSKLAVDASEYAAYLQAERISTGSAASTSGGGGGATGEGHGSPAR